MFWAQCENACQALGTGVDLQGVRSFELSKVQVRQKENAICSSGGPEKGNRSFRKAGGFDTMGDAGDD